MTHIAIILQTCGLCSTVKTVNTCYADTVETICGVSVTAVPELIVGEARAAVEIFGKNSSPLCIEMARQCVYLLWLHKILKSTLKSCFIVMYVKF